MESWTGGEDNVLRLTDAADAAPHTASTPSPDLVTTDREPLPRGTSPAGLRSAAASPVASARGRDVGAGVSASSDDALRHECLQLVQQAKRGDADAFQKLVEITQNRVARVVRSVVHCDRIAAEDLVQEVFLRVWKALPRFQGESVLAWIHTVATNVAISEWRQQRAQNQPMSASGSPQPANSQSSTPVRPDSSTR